MSDTPRHIADMITEAEQEHLRVLKATIHETLALLEEYPPSGMIPLPTATLRNMFRAFLALVGEEER